MIRFLCVFASFQQSFFCYQDAKAQSMLTAKSICLKWFIFYLYKKVGLWFISFASLRYCSNFFLLWRRKDAKHAELKTLFINFPFFPGIYEDAKAQSMLTAKSIYLKWFIYYLYKKVSLWFISFASLRYCSRLLFALKTQSMLN